MFLWVSSCLSSFFCFFLLCFRSSFDISRVRFICSTSFCPSVLLLSLYISLYSLCRFIVFSLCVFVLAFLFEVVGSLFGHFLVSWLHLFSATSFCVWSAKPVLSSFASGLSRTPLLVMNNFSIYKTVSRMVNISYKRVV